MARRIAACRAGGLPPGLGAVAWKLSFNPAEVSFSHSKHTSAAEVGHRTPAAATDNGTSRSPAGPAVRDSQYPWAPGRTVSSPLTTPQTFPKPLRSSARRCAAKIASARDSGKSPSITNAFATACRASETGNRGPSGSARSKASAVSERSQPSGSSGSLSIAKSLCLCGLTTTPGTADHSDFSSGKLTRAICNPAEPPPQQPDPRCRAPYPELDARRALTAAPVSQESGAGGYACSLQCGAVTFCYRPDKAVSRQYPGR